MPSRAANPGRKAVDMPEILDACKAIKDAGWQLKLRGQDTYAYNPYTSQWHKLVERQHKLRLSESSVVASFLAYATPIDADVHYMMLLDIDRDERKKLPGAGAEPMTTSERIEKYRQSGKIKRYEVTLPVELSESVNKILAARGQSFQGWAREEAARLVGEHDKK